MDNRELADEIERRMKDSSPVEDFAVFLAGNAAAIIAALRRQPSSDQVLVPREPTDAMLQAVASFPEHLFLSDAKHDEEWRARMEAATLADRATIRQTYLKMLAAAEAEGKP